MFLWWSDPYTGITAAMLVLGLALAAKLLHWRLRARTYWGRWGWGLSGAWFLLAGSWIFVSASLPAMSGKAQRSPAPDIQLRLSDGRSATLHSMAGQVVLLDFWATWCLPCRASEPALNALAQRYRQEPFARVRVSGDESEAKWRHSLLTQPSGALEMRDGDDALASKFGVNGRPTFILIDRRGQVRWKQAGWSPFSYFLLRHRVYRLLNEAP
ncbi:MAG: TlpA family protein disulfide reductase [Janthinobacterium lividum]